MNCHIGVVDINIGPTGEHRNVTYMYPKSAVESGLPLPAPMKLVEPLSPPGPQERRAFDALAVRLTSDGSPQYMIRPKFHETETFQLLDLSYIDMTGPAPVKIDHALTLPVAAAYRHQADMPQLGAAELTTGWPIFWAPPVYRNGLLWAVHHVRPALGERTIVRWYKITMNGWGPGCPTCLPTLDGWGSIDPGGDRHAVFPSIAVSANGAACITYTRASPTELPSMRTMRTDATGQFRVESIHALSLHPWLLNERWGDYSGCDADPIVEGMFWGHGEFVHDPPDFPMPGFQHWRTWIAPVGP